MPTRLLIIAALAVALWGCQKKDEAQAPQAGETRPPAASRSTTPLPPAEPLKAPAFLSAPLEASIIETTNEALPVWRKFAKNRPLLVIVSQGPAMAPIPAEIADEALELLRDGDDATLKTRTGMNDPDPVLLPLMSVSAALDADWLSGVIWVFPSSAIPDQIDPATFQQQLVSAGFASEDEAQALTFDKGVFRGTLRGKPFTAAPLAAVPALEQPALLHFDIDYFKPLYKGEIKTPLHNLLFDLLAGLKEKHWQVAGATVSLSNLGAELPLQTRFLGYTLADILHEPALLGGELPAVWQARADALYLENFMQKEKQKEIYEKLVKEEPADASLKFALYHVYRQYQDKGDEALTYLDQASRIDPIYGLEYLALAELALQRKRPAKAVEMAQLARAARPNDPFVLLQSVRTMLNAGAAEHAKTLLPQLSALHWSQFYYPELIQETEGLVSLLKN